MPRLRKTMIPNQNEAKASFVILNVFEEDCDEDCLAQQGVFQGNVAVFSGEKVVEVEMELAEHSEDFGVE